MAKDLEVVDIMGEEVINATKYVASPFVIIDSRNIDFRFTFVDTVADNCSSAKFLIGSK
ncbi:MAG TPA: hypothetical protein K8V56_00635 [Sporosarcina psychrophila]|uniref:Uncharacterized protein n=1 Tax=Sporosarcina psychrophila TaxID=1476 RepID=A0A921FVG6_SPOPS|nr:hypothetical protein [Sporosarcina psychrophila]